MESRLQKWGNSSGVRIPKVFMEDMKLKNGELVNIEMENEKIIITKARKEKLNLKMRIAKYDGPDLTNEFIWDEERGKEIW